MATNLKALRANNLKALYEIQLSMAQSMHAEVGTLIASADFDLARVKGTELAHALEKLNITANSLADVEP